MHTGVLGGIAYVLAVCAALSGWQSVEAKVVYVTPLGSDSHDGLTWVTAKGSVYGGLAAAVSGDQVWVAAGTYVNARSTPYAVPSGVGLYGGFDGTETDLSRRDVDANKAILDGGAYTTVVSLFGSAAGTRIDGFTIRNGASSIGGGGIRCGAGSAATIANNTIIGNSAIGGGGVFCVSASPTILSNKIVGNSAVSGGGIGCYDSPSAMIANNTVVSNDAGPMGGGIECDSASITNNIIAFNSSGIHMRSGGEPVLRRNCVHGNTLGGYLGVVDPTGTEGNISVDPRLADVRYADLHIQPDSPCLDAGDDEALVPGGIDIDLQPRVQGEHVDIGADESDGTVWPPSSYVVVRVSTDGDDANDGASWSATKRTVQAAVQAASVVGGEVWVAGGTYLETVTLMRNVHVYGGFAGTESLRGQRDWAGRRTTLQAALYGSVVVAKDIGAGLCTIDGFTIRNGTGSHLATRLIGGGGILCWRSAPLIINCVVTCNAAPHLGGGIACYEYSSPRIVNCVIAGNSLGGIGCSSSSPSVINCTICNNEGGPYGGGLSASTSSYAPSCPAVVNTIVAMNSSGLRIMSPAPGYYLLSHNCIYGNGLNDYASIPDLTGIDGNISADPLLAAAEYGNFHLQPGSPCREAGDDVYVEAAGTDMDGGLRIHGEHVDIGAYEAVGTQWAGEPNLIVRVSMIGDDENDGSSWALTKRTVQAALDTASHAGGQVWVRTGSYYESIVLLPYAHLRGGFAGTESAESQRDWIAHPTILEGSQGRQNVAVKHGYRLCSVDGFTIRHGWTGVHCETGSLALAHNLITANSGSGVNCENGSALVVNNIITANGGAGILCGYGSAPTIINNTITANVADEGGGIYSSTPGVRIINNLIAFNSSGIFYKGTQPSEVVVRHNCVYGNPGFGYSGIVDRTGTDGNISVDPKGALKNNLVDFLTQS